MSQDNQQNHFATNPKLFKEYIKVETDNLLEMESQSLFCEDPQWQVGLELEGWFLDKDLQPQAIAPKMLTELQCSELSEEVSKEIFEINLKHLPVKTNFLELFDKNLTDLFCKCNDWAIQNNTKIITIGMMPHMDPQHFNRELFVNGPRYHLLNDSLMQLRKNQPWTIKIKGDEDVEFIAHDICLEALTTSTQFHLKVPHSQLVKTYNRAQILAAPMVALAANARYFNSKSLWHETRVPLFQQTVSQQLPPLSHTNMEDRVFFGEDFIQKSIMEIFSDNLRFSPLLPLIEPEKHHDFHHLKLHNGTIWRWNRPVIGKNDSSNYHIRLEHRVQSAGTSPADIAAQLGFYVGILSYWERHGCELENLSFLTIRNNFYHAAKLGLQSSVVWTNNKMVEMQSLILNELIPIAKLGLSYFGLSQEEIHYYLDEILGERIKRGLSGAVWQRNKAVELNSVIHMLESYHEQQQSLKPLWKWD